MYLLTGSHLLHVFQGMRITPPYRPYFQYNPSQVKLRQLSTSYFSGKCRSRKFSDANFASVDNLVKRIREGVGYHV